MHLLLLRHLPLQHTRIFLHHRFHGTHVGISCMKTPSIIVKTISSSFVDKVSYSTSSTSIETNPLRMDDISTTITTSTTTPNVTSTTTTTTTTSIRNWFNNILESYSPQREMKRIRLGERLFRAAQEQAYHPIWYQSGLIPLHFRPRHAMLTMHVWFLHRRLILDPTQPTFSLGVQEELFDFLWNDTKARIRAEQVNELTVYSHLKTVQQYTMLHMTHYDHAFSDTFSSDPKQRLEECMKAIWIHVFNQNPQVDNDLLQTMAVYLEYQLENIVYRLPDEYFFHGQVGWGNVPDFATHLIHKTWSSKEEEDKWKAYYDLPPHWKRVCTDAGQAYYWNTVTQETQWNQPMDLIPSSTPNK